jgi:hypothetical protein
MGKVSLWFMGAAVAIIGLYFAALQITDKIPPPIPLIMFAFACVFAFLFILSGIVYIYFLSKNRLNPICFLDDIRCIYWTKEKQIQVNWLFCDYSKSTVFVFDSVVCFGEQIINIDGRRSLQVLGDPDAKCINGIRIFVEQSKHDIEVDNPNNCQVKLSIKPHGRFWATKRKTKEVITQLVNH